MAHRGAGALVIQGWTDDRHAVLSGRWVGGPGQVRSEKVRLGLVTWCQTGYQVELCQLELGLTVLKHTKTDGDRTDLVRSIRVEQRR